MPSVYCGSLCCSKFADEHVYCYFSSRKICKFDKCTLHQGCGPLIFLWEECKDRVRKKENDRQLSPGEPINQLCLVSKSQRPNYNRSSDNLRVAGTAVFSISHSWMLLLRRMLSEIVSPASHGILLAFLQEASLSLTKMYRCLTLFCGTFFQLE
jgi:hypothetical protein